MTILGFENPLGPKGFLGRLSIQFGWRYVAMVMIIYGVNQAISYTWGNFAKNFYFSNAEEIGGLGLPAAVSNDIDGVVNIPWQIKSLYGILSDAFAVMGYHRTPYVMFSTILGASGWALLGLVNEPSVNLCIVLLFCTNLAIAMPDVMIDATVAERCQQKPAYAVDLQSLCWGTYGLGAMVANLSAGYMYDSLGARPVFVITAFVPVLVLVPTCLGWMAEEKDENAAEKREKFYNILRKFPQAVCSATPKQVQAEKDSTMVADNPASGQVVFTEEEKDLRNGKLYILAVILSIVSISIGTIVTNAGDDNVTKGIAYVSSVAVVCGSIWWFERDIHIDLVKASCYIFLSGVLQPRALIMFYWVREDVAFCGKGFEDLNRPCIDAPFLSSINVVGNIMIVFGTVLYNRFLSHMSYRKIWTFSQTCLLFVSMFEYIWVNRWNLAIGYPDRGMLVLSDEVLIEIVDRFDSMPLFILAAKLCPKGFEATLFAMIMGLSNFGGSMGRYLGSMVQSAMGVTSPDFDYLDSYILVRNSTRLLVLLIIPFLVPQGTPQDPSIYESENIDQESLDGDEKRYSLDAMVELQKAKGQRHSITEAGGR